MPQDVTCPECEATFPVTESRTAFTVACPECDADVTVEFKKPTAPPEPGQPHYEVLVRPGALAAPAVTVPKQKRNIDDDDEGDEARSKGGGAAAVVMLSGGLGVLIVLGGLGLTAWVLFGLIDTTPSVTYNRPGFSQPNNQPNQPGVPNVPNRPNPFAPPPPSALPKDTFELRPVAAALPAISAATLPSNPASVELGRVGMIAVGGGGRYLVMHLPDKGQLTVFDVNTAQFTATVPADNSDAYLTAGASKVVLALPNARVFRVYSLPGLTKEYDASAPDNIRGLAMGSRTNGPLATVGLFGRVQLWDVGGGGITEVEGSSAAPGVHWHDRCLRAAPDGTAFSTHDGFRQGQNTILLTVQNRKWKISPDTFATPFPGVDGNFYGNGTSVTKSYLEHRIGGVGAGSGAWFLPSVSSKDFFLKINQETTGGGVSPKKTMAVSIHKGRNSTAVAPGTTVFNDLPEFEGLMDQWSRDPSVVYDQHFFLIPEAKLFVTLTAKRDRLVVRRIDPR